MHIRSVSLTDAAAEAALELFQYANDGSREVADLIDALADALAHPGFGGIRISVNEDELEAALELFEDHEDLLDDDGADAFYSFEATADHFGWIISDRIYS